MENDLFCPQLKFLSPQKKSSRNKQQEGKFEKKQTSLSPRGRVKKILCFCKSSQKKKKESIRTISVHGILTHADASASTIITVRNFSAAPPWMTLDFRATAGLKIAREESSLPSIMTTEP
jgi:hypothetical protein